MLFSRLSKSLKFTSVQKVAFDFIISITILRILQRFINNFELYSKICFYKRRLRDFFFLIKIKVHLTEKIKEE